MYSSMPVMLGQYRPLDSFWHKLDVRAKLAPVLAILVLALLSNSIWFYLLLGAGLVLSLFSAGLKAGMIAGNFKPILMLALITSLYHLIFSSPETKVVFNLLGWEITKGAVELASFYSLRLIIFVSAAFLVTLTSSPSDLAEGFIKLLKPLKRLKVPLDDLALVTFIALRFIPILYDEFVAIRNAQIIRGMSYKGRFLKRLKQTITIIVPVLMAAIQRADELALALEVRGYRSGQPRSFYSTTSFGPKDVLFAVGSTVVIVGLYFLTRKG